MCSPFDLAHPASANPNIARTLWLESLQQLSGKSIQGLFRSGSSSETRPPPLAVPMHAQIQWRAEPAGYSGLVAQHTCSVCYGNQRGCDIAPTADRDADPHALASSLHWLCHHSHSSCVAVGERHNAVVQCLLLIGYAAILEAGQLYATGRQASLQDFASSSSGVLIGAMLVWIARTCWVRVKILRPTFVE
jgi:hypothetical protein